MRAFASATTRRWCARECARARGRRAGAQDGAAAPRAGRWALTRRARGARTTRTTRARARFERGVARGVARTTSVEADDGGAGGGDAGETIDVWCYDARAGTRGDDASENELARRAEALVSEDERTELMGNATRLISRAFARTVLMRYDEDARDARDVTFAYGARGKPSVRGPATLAARCGFSVSHCDGLTAVAVTTNGDACGIDVEDENRRIGTDVGKFARRWLSDDETRRLSDIVADDERARAFMRLWTAKESYVKALGLGIAGRPFREFDIAWDVAEDAAKTWSMDLRDVTDDGTVPWRFALLKPRASQSHVMSLCAPAGADGRMPRVRVRWASPFEPLVDVDAADADVLALGGSRATI